MKVFVGCALWVWHHAKNVFIAVGDPGNVQQRAVGVAAGILATIGGAISK